MLLVDDMIDTGGTFSSAIKTLKQAGAMEIYGACTHPVLSGDAVDMINRSALSKLTVTDSISLTAESGKIEVISVSKIFAEAIKRIHMNQSISSLFDVDKR